MQKGKFVVFEGIDGSGKSTQIKLLAKALQQNDINCKTTLEPTFGMVGEVLHNILSGKKSADPKVTAALFAADRLDHLTNAENGICKMLDEGTTVLCDRYYFSSYAYQSVDVPTDWVIQTNSLAKQILTPDCTVFIDTDPRVSMKRISENRETTEIYETLDRLIAVRKGYMDAFERMKDCEKIKIINGNGSIQQIADEIKNFVLTEVFGKICKDC